MKKATLLLLLLTVLFPASATPPSTTGTPDPTPVGTTIGLPPRRELGRLEELPHRLMEGYVCQFPRERW